MGRIVVVSMGGQGASALVSLIRGGGHDVTDVVGWREGLDAVIELSPEVLITSERLGDASGLDLIISVHTILAATRSILLDQRYKSETSKEARRYGAIYLVEPVPGEDLLAQVASQLTGEQAPRRWLRKKLPAALPVQVSNRPGRMVDLSYGGLQVELIQLEDMPSRFDVVVPGADLKLQAKPVWTRRGPYGWMWCGAELSDVSADALANWEHFVDSV
jgi:DNA-binding response OmpR family regulator